MSNEQKAYLTENGDESTHQILSYGLLFSTFYHFPYTADPPTSTAPIRLAAVQFPNLPNPV